MIRRHPDIATATHRRRCGQTAALQAHILANCWHNLAGNGYLLYITCSMLKAENEDQLQAVLATHKRRKSWILALIYPTKSNGTSVINACLHQNDGDGFYYALLQKRG